MRSIARLALWILAAACFVAVSHAHSATTSGARSSNGGQASASTEKPQNPLEIKPPSPGEEKAYKAFQKFQSMPDSDAAKKTQAAEDFISKFPNSGYATFVYSYLAVAYIQAGQIDKGIATGEKDLQMNPSDFRTMGVLSQTISRMVTDSTPDVSAKLAKAETYAKDAIGGVATWVKPGSMPDDKFAALKNETLAMAHGSLGLVAIHKNNFEGAVPELEQAIQLGSNTDLTNYYLLGLANLNASHYDKAAAAFEKCAAVKGTNLTATCTSLLDQANKEAAKAQPK